MEPDGQLMMHCTVDCIGSDDLAVSKSNRNWHVVPAAAALLVFW